MSNESTAGYRLITQNLLTSAAYAVREKEPDWLSIQDLSVLIELYCLYDRAVVIGREANYAINNWDDPLFDLFKRTDFINAAYIEQDDEGERLVRTAQRHLLTFLGEQDSAKYRDLIKQSLNAPQATYELSRIPDRGEELSVGQEYLLTTPSRADILQELDRDKAYSRATTFLVRTFLYLAYADVANLAYTPDLTRSAVSAAVCDAEQLFRDRLLNAMKSSWTGDAEFVDPSVDRLQLQRKLSPLATIVLERAYPDRNRIVPEIEHLRAELSDVRKKLRDAEDKLQWRSRKERQKAEQEWNAVFQEVERTYGQEEELTSVKGIIRFAVSLIDVPSEPDNYAAWAAEILSIPIQAAVKLLRRRTLVDIHRLHRDLPAPGRLRTSVNRLFGKISER
jgi:hypothetical protein